MVVPQGAAATDNPLRGVMDTGMTRKIDDLGRIVIPAETRRLFKIREGDYLTIDRGRERLQRQRRLRYLPQRDRIEAPVEFRR